MGFELQDSEVHDPRQKMFGSSCGQSLATVDGEELEKTRLVILANFYGPFTVPVDLCISSH